MAARSSRAGSEVSQLLRAQSGTRQSTDEEFGTETDMIPTSPAANMLLDAIRRAGGRPLIVGGVVRDALLGVASKDIDIEVHGGVDTASFLREIAKIGAVAERGRSFGILAARVESEDFEVALPAKPRHDGERADGQSRRLLATGLDDQRDGMGPGVR